MLDASDVAHRPVELMKGQIGRTRSADSASNAQLFNLKLRRWRRRDPTRHRDALDVAVEVERSTGSFVTYDPTKRAGHAGGLPKTTTAVAP